MASQPTTAKRPLSATSAARSAPAVRKKRPLAATAGRSERWAGSMVVDSCIPSLILLPHLRQVLEADGEARCLVRAAIGQLDVALPGGARLGPHPFLLQRLGQVELRQR